ncbi:hypothetical protein BH10ACI2_BH10ACI2_24190 [soil metagenome]
MVAVTKAFLVVAVVILFSLSVSAQVDEICGEAGITPGLDSPFAHVPYVYGRVTLQGFDKTAKAPKVTVIMADTGQSAERWNADKSGNYCFKRKGSGGSIVVEMNGIEVARRALQSVGAAQQREDFEIVSPNDQKSPPPSVISAKFPYPPNPKTADLYKQTIEAEKSKDSSKMIEHLKGIVSIDPADFLAWNKLGSLYIDQKSYPEADAALRKSLELRVDYTPAWINVGQLRVAQKAYPAAIEIFKHAVELDPTSAIAFQQLGQAYLLNKQGTLGAEALNQALKLDPTGMAECHLQLAHLYELAGAKQLAASEYKAFVEKVPNHPDRKKFEKFIKDNP